MFRIEMLDSNSTTTCGVEVVRSEPADPNVRVIAAPDMVGLAVPLNRQHLIAVILAPWVTISSYLAG
jgi:hypothetical protein